MTEAPVFTSWLFLISRDSTNSHECKTWPTLTDGYSSTFWSVQEEKPLVLLFTRQVSCVWYVLQLHKSTSYCIYSFKTRMYRVDVAWASEIHPEVKPSTIVWLTSLIHTRSHFRAAFSDGILLLKSRPLLFLWPSSLLGHRFMEVLNPSKMRLCECVCVYM